MSCSKQLSVGADHLVGTGPTLRTTLPTVQPIGSRFFAWSFVLSAVRNELQFFLHNVGVQPAENLD